MPEPRPIEIRAQTIRLGQLLKLAGLVDSGADVKALLAERAVEVNSEVENRRGRQLVVGDIVEYAGERIRVAPGGDRSYAQADAMNGAPMTISGIDENTALVLIDLQKGVVTMPTVHPAAEIVRTCAELARSFRGHRLPVVLVNVTGGAPGRTEAPSRGSDRPADWAELVPELDRSSGDIFVTKRTWGAFQGTSLDEELRGRGVTQIVLGGIVTSKGVESTARAAHEHGYNVTLVVDAMTDADADAHANSVERIFPALGETGAAADVVELLGDLQGR